MKYAIDKDIEDSLLNLVLGRNNYHQLKDINIFFSGGTGLLGRWMLKSLNFVAKNKKINIKVTLLTRNKENIKKLKKEINSIKVDFIIGDISNIKINHKNYDIIFHFAASSSKEDNLNKIKVSNTIINGTANIIKNAQTCNIKNIVFLSSGAVYGKNSQKDLGWKETDNFSPDVNNENAVYGLSKKCSESLLVDWAKKNNNNLLIFRSFSFGVITENGKSHFAFDNFIKSRINRKEIIMNSYGTSKRNFIHPIDLCNWIFLSLPLKRITILNSGSKKNVTIFDLAKKIATLKITGLPKVSFNRGKDRKKENYIPNLNAIHAKGYAEKISLDKQIKLSIYNALENKKLYEKNCRI